MFARLLARVLGTKTLTPNRNLLRFRPRVEGLEIREVPAALHWSGAAMSGGVHDPDAGNKYNWFEQVVPRPGDDLYFSWYSPQPSTNNDCDLGMILAAPGPATEEHPTGTPGEPGWLHGIYIADNYAGTVTLLVEHQVAEFVLDSEDATVDQDDPTCNLTVTSKFDWRAGTLNSAEQPVSNVILDGAIGTIAPVNEGIVVLGSNIASVNSALLSMYAGTVACVNTIGWGVSTQGGIKVIPGTGKQVRVTDPGGSFNTPPTATIAGTGFVEVVSGEGIFEGSCTITGGRLTLREDTTLWLALRGGGASFLMSGGKTELYGGSTLISDGSASMSDGLLTTRVGGDLTSDATRRTRTFNVSGGNIVLGSDGTHFYGTLTCTGDVNWTGGTYRPHVEDLGGAAGKSDVWKAAGTFAIWNGAALSPMALDSSCTPVMPTSGVRWLILEGNPMSGTNNLSFDQDVWVGDPVGVTQFFIKGK